MVETSLYSNNQHEELGSAKILRQREKEFICLLLTMYSDKRFFLLSNRITSVAY